MSVEVQDTPLHQQQVVSAGQPSSLGSATTELRRQHFLTLLAPLISPLRDIGRLFGFGRYPRRRAAVALVLPGAMAVGASLLDSIGVSMFFPLLQGGDFNQLFRIVPLLGPWLSSLSLSIAQALSLLALFLAIKSASDFLSTLVTDWFSRDLLRALRTRVAATVFSSPLLEIERMRVGEVSNRITMDAPRATTYVSTYMKLLVQGLMAMTYLFALWWISAPVALLVVVTGVPLLAAFSHLYARLSAITVQSNRLRDENNLRVVERLHQARLVKTLGTEWAEIATLTKQFDAWSQLLFVRSILESLSRLAMTLVPCCTILGLLGLTLVTEASVRSLLVVLGPSALVSMRLLTCFSAMNGLAATIKVNQDSVSLILDQFATGQPPARGRPKTHSRPIEQIHRVELCDVSFSYGGTELLRHVSFTLEREHPVFLRGASGSGKTTLAHLVRGLLQPTAGQILVNAMDLNELYGDRIRRLIGYMTQEAYLFHGSVRENLLYGNDQPGITDEEIYRQLEVCAIRPLVASLPGGLEYVLTERGSIFSVGERQRISLARILLRRPSLLILDEVTTSLDPASKAIILQSLERLMSDCLCLLISHDLDIKTDRFRVYELEAGRLIERSAAHSRID